MDSWINEEINKIIKAQPLQPERLRLELQQMRGSVKGVGDWK